MASVRMGRFTCSFTTWVSSSADGRWRSGTGWRAWSLIRSSSATMIQLAISDEPPYDMNGVVRPVSGISLVTPPMTTNTCRAIAIARPTASSLPNGSRQTRAVRKPRSTIRP